MKDSEHYSLLADMLIYPCDDQKRLIPQWEDVVRKYVPGQMKYLDAFTRHVLNEYLEKRQEYYVNVFDVQPLCSLDIGYNLFGDDHRRGHFMANLMAEHRKAGNKTGSELPDHLPVVLRLLKLLNDPEFREELVCSILIPAIHEMISGFRSDDNHYRNILRIIVSIMETDYPGSKYERFQVTKSHNQSKDLVSHK